MIHTKNFNSHTIEDFDKSLGTPSGQAVFRILVCWESLPIREIILKSKLSESQIHNTLKDLISLGLVVKESRGVYSLSKSQIASNLKKAYEEILEQHVGNLLYTLSKQLDIMPLHDIEELWTHLIDQWKPILEKKFKRKAASITNSIIERLS